MDDRPVVILQQPPGYRHVPGSRADRRVGASGHLDCVWPVLLHSNGLAWQEFAVGLLAC